MNLPATVAERAVLLDALLAVREAEMAQALADASGMRVGVHLRVAANIAGTVPASDWKPGHGRAWATPQEKG